MPLPDSCQLTPSHLVFWELATPAQLADEDKLYEYCCTIACTNALRPMGTVDVRSEAIPHLADEQQMLWGRRSLTAQAAKEYTVQGFVLCELRLPVQPIGAAVPPGVSVVRPPGT
jgi:hypothetical protein